MAHRDGEKHSWDGQILLCCNSLYYVYGILEGGCSGHSSCLDNNRHFLRQRERRLRSLGSGVRAFSGHDERSHDGGMAARAGAIKPGVLCHHHFFFA